MRSPLALLVFLLVFPLAACDSGGPTDPPPRTDNLEMFFDDLPAWTEFAPAEPDQSAAPVGEATTDTVEVAEVLEYEEDGDVNVLENVSYECTSTPYSITQNPTEVVIYSPNEDILFPGAFIQGKSHRDAGASRGLLPLVIPERAPIDVTIDFLNDDNTRTVQPTKSAVQQAIGEIVQNQSLSGLASGSRERFSLETTYSEEQFALQARLSGRYLGYSASASGSISQGASKTTVTAHYYENMYTVSVERPGSGPEAFFADDFTQADLDRLVASGQMGPDNLPVYIANVVYGRMMTFSLTSTASEREIKSAIEASFDRTVASGNGELSSKQESILREAEIQITTFGGNSAGTAAMIRTGDWSAYFTESADVTQAKPLSYTFRNLEDGSIAGISESTDYNLTTCDARQATPGTYDLRDGEPLSLPFTPEAGGNGRALADVTGDGIDDLVFSRATGGGIEAAVAAGDGSGGFGAPASGTAGGDWNDAFFLTGDVDGSPGDEMVWVQTTTGPGLRIQVGRASGGTITFLDAQQRTGGWEPYRKVRLGDVDGDGADDLVVNQTNSGGNFVYVFFATGDGTFDLAASSRHTVSTNPGFGGYDLLVMDYTDDGRADLVWSVHNSANNVIHRAPAKSSRDAAAPFGPQPSFLEYGFSGWSNYTRAVGQFNPSNGEDMVFVSNSGTAIHRAYSTGNSFSLSTGGNFQRINLFGSDGGNLEYVLAGDVNDDGVDDLIANDLDGVINRTFVLLGQSDGVFDPASRLSQTHPDTGLSWGAYVPLVGQLTNDDRADIVWVNEGGTRVYVGIARE